MLLFNLSWRHCLCSCVKASVGTASLLVGLVGTGTVTVVAASLLVEIVGTETVDAASLPVEVVGTVTVDAASPQAGK